MVIFFSLTQRCAGRLHARPRPAAAAVHLAALHREVDVVAAGIAGDDLHLGAEHAVDDARELVGVGGRAGAADVELRGQQVFELGDLGAAVPHHADADLVVGAADPVELGCRRTARPCGRTADRSRCRGRWCRSPCRPWWRRCRASWRAAGCRRLPCSSASPSDCRGCACRDGGRSAAHRRRSRRRRCSRSSCRRSCPCRTRRASGRRPRRRARQEPRMRRATVEARMAIIPP